MFTFKSFRAIKEPDTCERYLQGHVKVLQDYGITNITTNNREWMEMPNVYGVIAERNSDGLVVGGVRVHIADGGIPLPVEKAIGRMDAKIYSLIQSYMEEGTGEICGLWNAKDVAGVGLSVLLVRAGIAIVNQIRLESLFTICAEYTLPMVRKVGFTVEDSLGNNGQFIYPNENYIARVLRKMNAVTLDTADEYDRSRIIALRNNPDCEVIEKAARGEPLPVTYKLTLPRYED